MSLLSVFFTAFGGTAVALVVVAYLGRSLINLQVLRAIEKYKEELQQKSAVLKAELSIYAHEQSIGLSRLDGERSQAIKEIYAVANKWQETFLEITKPNQPTMLPEFLRERYRLLAKDLVTVSEELSVRCRDNAIFFQPESYNIIARFGRGAMELSCSFYDQTFGKFDMSKDPKFEELSKSIERQRTVLSDAPKEDFGKLQALLLDEFRRLMKAIRPATTIPSSGPPKS